MPPPFLRRMMHKPFDNQIEIPASFLALFIPHGHSRPTVAEAVIVARYEQCEDMACLLVERAHMLVAREDFRRAEVLDRCLQGLLADGSAFTTDEAAWVIHRLAELLEWPPPAPAG